MPASLERIRNSISVATTLQDKGLPLTLRPTAYDNGMVQLDGIPINDHVDYDQFVGWTGALEVMTATVNESQKQVAKWEKERAAAPT